MKTAQHAMRICAFIGTLGAGKTATAMATAHELAASCAVSKGKLAYIINDDGASGNVDAMIAETVAEVLTSVNGCFTCSDDADTRAILDRLAQGGTECVFFEGFGIVSGEETRQFLGSVPFHSEIVCILDVRHFRQNLVRYGDIVASQIAAATIGVGLTKYPDSVTDISDRELDEVVDYIAHIAPGVTVFLVPEGSGVARLLVEEKLDDHHVHDEHCGHSHGHVHMADCNHAHEHDEGEHRHHGHAHEAPVYPYSFSLREGTHFADVQSAFRNMPTSVLRVKGAVDGKHFDEVHRDWALSYDDPRSFVTFYATEPIVVSTHIPALALLIHVDEESRDLTGKSYELTRRDVVPREETIAEIELLISALPTAPIVVSTPLGVSMKTHPEELQILKEIARRPSVIKEWFAKALTPCMWYWVASMEYLIANEPAIVASEVATNKREIGVSLAWWADRFATEFPVALMDKVRMLPIARIAAEGARSLTSLNSDPDRAYWQCEELVRAICFEADKNLDRGVLVDALSHGASLAQSDKERVVWERGLNKLSGTKV